MFLQNKKLAAACLAFLIVLLVWPLSLWSDSPTEALRLKLTDRLYLAQTESIQPSSEIVVIAIDDQTLADPRFGRWQEWRRSYFADLLSTLANARPKAIGIDITFSEPSKVPGDDDLLAAAIEQAGNVVLVGRVDAESGPVFPLEKFAGAAGLGFANLNLDPDSVVRRIPLLLNFGLAEESVAIPSFTLALAQLIQPDTTRPPLDPDDCFLINFFGQPYGYRYISFADAYDGRFGDSLQDKIVLIGVTPADLRDLESTPTSFGTKMPGVEIHANALQTLLEQHYLRLPATWVSFVLLLLTAFAAVALFIALPLAPALALLVGSMAGYYFLVQFCFSRGLVLDIFHPLLVLALAFVGAYLYRFVFVDREKRQLKGAFSHYLSGAMVERIAADPSALQLGGEEKELTIFFSDIANFTTISERLTPTELVQLLNNYLGTMTESIMSSGGTLDKYIGDAIMAFWGAPLPAPQHATQACLAALDNLALLKKLKTEGTLPPDLDFHIRIGLASGPAVVGNMGSDQRFNYTVMGDTVNLASRLEGLGKEYGVSATISEATYLAAASQIEAREIDLVRVKGKQHGVRIYELVARQGALTSEQQKAFPIFSAALEAYRAQQWDLAQTKLAEVLRLLPDDGPSHTLLRRLEHYRAHPPAAAWDGVHTMTSK